MAEFTLREVIDQAASRLGQLAAGQALDADELGIYENEAAMLLDQLAEDGIVTVADTEAIPASWCPYLATLLANLAGPHIGAPFDLEVKARTEAVLRKLVRGHQTYETLQVDYF